MKRYDLIRAARAELWRTGDASEYLLDDGQKEWVSSFRSGDGAACWMIGRQRGKSFAALTLACCEAIRHPGSIIRYAALTGKSAKAIVAPTLEQVLEDCPDDCRPEVREMDGTVRFPNGSTLTWAGTDNEQFDRLRGPRAHLVLLDESAFYADLERVESALLPQLTTTQGKTLYLSTPPNQVSHPFVRRYRAAQAVGRARHSTIDDNPRLGREGRDRIARTEAARLGMTLEQLEASTFWRREYLAELVTEESRAAFPAWTEAVHSRVVGDWQVPKYRDAYQAHDPGVSGDPHASLFAYYDPATAKLVIEDELELRSAATTISKWAETIKAREAELYGAKAWDGTIIGAKDWAREYGGLPEYAQRAISDRAPAQPYLRVGDNAQGICRDMSADYGLTMFPTPKHEKAIEVDRANTMLAQGRILIHSRCVRLIEQLYSTLWDRTHSRWEHSDKDHGDLVDCLVYLCRNIRWNRDCRPPPEQEVFVMPEHMRSQADKKGISALKGVFGKR